LSFKERVPTRVPDRLTDVPERVTVLGADTGSARRTEKPRALLIT
jgi:hypothetical protein